MDRAAAMLWAIVILYAVGLASAFMGYASYKKLAKGYCEAGSLFSCEAVYLLPDKYVKPLGLHFSELAPPYFAALLAVGVMLLMSPGSTGLLQALALLNLVGVAFIPYLVFLEVKVAGALCLYCTIMHAVLIVNQVLILKLA